MHPKQETQASIRRRLHKMEVQCERMDRWVCKVTSVVEDAKDKADALRTQLGKLRGFSCSARYYRTKQYRGWRCKCRRVEDWASQMDQFFFDYCSKCRLGDKRKALKILSNKLKETEEE